MGQEHALHQDGYLTAVIISQVDLVVGAGDGVLREAFAQCIIREDDGPLVATLLQAHGLQLLVALLELGNLHILDVSSIVVELNGLVLHDLLI